MESQFERLLKEKINLMIDMRVEAMTITGLSNFEEYKQTFGYIEALRQVLGAIEEVQSDMRKE